MKEEKRSVWGNLIVALALTLPVLFVGLILFTIVGAIDDAITSAQVGGYFWLFLIPAFILSLIYAFVEQKYKIDREREKTVDGLLLYWQDSLAKENKPDPSEKELETVRGMLLERLKVWAWFKPELWNKYYSGEKYSKSLFGMIDNFIPYWENARKSRGY
ncbi:MAG: hypothetical protein A2126_03620 [Candidatus Woykebacteria bacterium GWB1_45_5]|uniref:Uncharacterized protein n=2 Tax=Candidatus Woykeibacteriota TaxID=1817899 RepID=A0A1G1W3S0_9BACT|nr:MAG: hypothetical protein A2113_03385 [Candidatus Woykebacteria bacterium GWA1_44_8]OGY24501.1 MAG: hypothetical protein A2126_03620 [Candidatus Woykebacteria bacterium GWB1_45_5]